MSNWMRYWFCGWGKHDFNTRSKDYIKVLQKTSFDSFDSFDNYDYIFKMCKNRLKKDGYAIFHLGHSKKCDMGQSLIPYAEKYFEILDLLTESVEHCERHGITDKGSVKAHQFLILINK